MPDDLCVVGDDHCRKQGQEGLDVSRRDAVGQGDGANAIDLEPEVTCMG